MDPLVDDGLVTTQFFPVRSPHKIMFTPGDESVEALGDSEEALNLIGALPSMDPRPNATNIRMVNHHLDERLSIIPSYQSAILGYAYMAKKAELYALDSTVPWMDFENPGPVRQGTDVSLDAGAQRDQQAIYDGRVAIFTSQANVKRAIIAALNLCVPKKIQACGRRHWSTTLQGQPVPKNNPRPPQKYVWQAHADGKNNE